MPTKKSSTEDLLAQHLAVDASRLDRIENKIDKLAETVISLARAEEKLLALEEDKQFIMDRMVKNEDRIEHIEKKVDETAITVTVINRLFWIAITVTATAWIGNLLMH